MRLCFDATRFGAGLDGALELAAAHGISAIEYSFAPFAISSKSKTSLDTKEKKSLRAICDLSEELSVSIACLNLEYCLLPDESKAQKNGAFKEFMAMIGKIAQVSQAINCPKVSLFITAGSEANWLESAEKKLQSVSDQLKKHDISLLLRLSTAPQFRGRSLKNWQAMEPQDWRNLLSVCPDASLSFSPADCLWLGIDYLKILPGIISGVDHIEAHDVEIIRELLKDSGMYGPLWWRYRMPGKGQVDWTQLIEALKLYDFKGDFSIHLDDEFIACDQQSLEEALAESTQFLSPLVNN